MIRKYARAAREHTDAALLWLAFEPAGRYLNGSRFSSGYRDGEKASLSASKSLGNSQRSLSR